MADPQKNTYMLFYDFCSSHFLAARGSLAPRARSILAMTALFGMAFPDSYSLMTCGCMLSCCGRPGRGGGERRALAL